jgi:tol-pal system protein YbgF
MKRTVVMAMLSSVAFTALAAPPAAPKPTLEQRVSILERKVKTLSSLVLRMDTLQREVQQLRGEIEVQNHAMDALKKRQRDLYLDVDQRLSQINSGAAPSAVPAAAVPVDQGAAASQAPVPVSAPTPQPAVVDRTPAPVAASPTPVTAPAGVVQGDPAQEEASYQAAFEMLMQRRYREAQKAFQAFLSQYPQGSYSDNAQYWLAEASYVTRDFQTALAEFDKVVTLYPDSPKVADALLKTGFIQYELKQWPEARASLERVRQQYPNSTASRLALKRLDRMRSEGH